MRVGMNGFLTKPLLLSTLMESVQRFTGATGSARTAQVGAANETDKRPSGP
jgi:hypothetical protein